MSWFYRQVVRPVLFNYDSEQIHDATLGNLGRLSRSRVGLDLIDSFFGMSDLPVQLWGLRFPNPVGVAAGMDKQGVAVPAWAAFGFGFSELGGVTWHAQAGNPAPRMFRAIEDGALINRMGFNNGGAEALAERFLAPFLDVVEPLCESFFAEPAERFFASAGTAAMRPIALAADHVTPPS